MQGFLDSHHSVAAKWMICGETLELAVLANYDVGTSSFVSMLRRKQMIKLFKWASICACCCSCFFVQAAFAQINISDGTSTYTKSTTDGAVTFVDSVSGNVMSEERWLVRYADLGGLGNPIETTFLEVGGTGVVLDGVTNAGDTGTMNWSVNSPGFGDALFDIDISYVVSTASNGRAELSYSVDVIPQNAIANGVIQVFNYFDYDVEGFGGDSADIVTNGTETRIDILDSGSGTTAFRSGENVTGWEIRAWGAGATNIDDSVVGSNTYNLANNTAPFAPGDFTGAFQWDFNLGNVGSAPGSLSGASAVSAVPEPASASLLLLAGIGMLYRRRR